MSSTKIIESGQRKEESPYMKSKKAKRNPSQSLAARLKGVASAKERAKLLRKKRKQTRQVLVTPAKAQAQSKPAKEKKQVEGKFKNTNPRRGGKARRGSKGGKGGKGRKGVKLQGLT